MLHCPGLDSQNCVPCANVLSMKMRQVCTAPFLLHALCPLRAQSRVSDQEKAQTGPAKRDKIGARVLRGGSWYSRPQDIRVGCRHSHAANYQLNVIGFRLALDSR
jgi:hypothetical protein